jgi:hypothetical protein
VGASNRASVNFPAKVTKFCKSINGGPWRQQEVHIAPTGLLLLLDCSPRTALCLSWAIIHAPSGGTKTALAEINVRTSKRAARDERPF